MIDKIVKFVRLLWDFKSFKAICSFRFSGYLFEIGWFNALKANTPVDVDNEPLPWTTYSFIDFISLRLKSHFSIFEYGSGNSTLFYAARVKSVTTVEHDGGWYETLLKKIPQNVLLIYQALEYNKLYCRTAKQTERKYDMIIIDGRDRVNCILQSVESLKEDGVIVLDDAERESYKEAFDYMKGSGFKNIDFWGISPGLFYKKATTIFYKSNNCLNI